MSDEEREFPRLHPFDIRDAIHLQEKRIANLTDLFHETQKLVHGLEQKVDTVAERINKGISPTMQEVKAQNVEIEKSLIRVEGKMDLLVSEVNSKIALQAQDFGGRLSEFDEFKNALRGLVWKVAGAAAVGFFATAYGMWVYIHDLQVKMDIAPYASVVEPRRR